MYFIAFFGFAEEIIGVTELSVKLIFDLRADLIAAAANSGADCSFHILRAAAKVTAHLTDALLDNSLQRSAPAGVKNANRLQTCVHDDDGQAVSGEYAEHNSGRSGDEPVTGERVLRSSGDAVNQIGVDLANSGERPAMGACR